MHLQVFKQFSAWLLMLVDEILVICDLFEDIEEALNKCGLLSHTCTKTCTKAFYVVLLIRLVMMMHTEKKRI